MSRRRARAGTFAAVVAVGIAVGSGVVVGGWFAGAAHAGVRAVGSPSANPNPSASASPPAAIAGVATATAAGADTAAGAHADTDADSLIVEVLTFGAGGHPFSRFGHDALRIADRRTGSDIVYNFGTFSSDSPNLVVDFLRGRLSYWLSRSHIATTLLSYRRENRDIEAQELDLDPAQKRALATRLEVNARPENRAYRYDYFGDNCSTRVRDALDAVTGGRLRAVMTGPGTMTLRAHALRSVASDLPLYAGLLVVLGPLTDQPIDRWTEAFLPAMLQRSLRAVTVGGGSGAATAERPLVKSERLVFASSRAPVPAEPPRRLADLFGVGIFSGLVLCALGVMSLRAPAARIGFGVVVALAGVAIGAVGCFLVGAWAFTPHRAVYANQNILLFAPFAIVLGVAGIGVAAGRRWARRAVGVVATGALAFATVGLALKWLPWPWQDNGALIALMLPLWAGLALGARAASRTDRLRPT